MMIKSGVNELTGCDRVFEPHLLKRIQDGAIVMVVQESEEAGVLMEAVVLSGDNIGGILRRWRLSDFETFQGSVTLTQ